MSDELTLLEMAEALNEMDRDLTSWEAGFHENVLVDLRAGFPITGPQEAKLREIYEKYLGEDAVTDDAEIDY